MLREQIEEVPQRFPLCHVYRACVDAVDPQAFLVYEEWVSREAYVECSNSAYVAGVMSQLGPLMSTQDAAFYEAEYADLPLT